SFHNPCHRDSRCFFSEPVKGGLTNVYRASSPRPAGSRSVRRLSGDCLTRSGACLIGRSRVLQARKQLVYPLAREPPGIRYLLHGPKTHRSRPPSATLVQNTVPPSFGGLA